MALMQKENIKSILEHAFKQSNKTPSLWHLPKILQIKTQLEQCSTVPEVLSLLEKNKEFIKDSLGLSEQIFSTAVTSINKLNE
jgi:hypothetical protein